MGMGPTMSIYVGLSRSFECDVFLPVSQPFLSAGGPGAAKAWCDAIDDGCVGLFGTSGR